MLGSGGGGRARALWQSVWPHRRCGRKVVGMFQLCLGNRATSETDGQLSLGCSSVGVSDRHTNVGALSDGHINRRATKPKLNLTGDSSPTSAMWTDGLAMILSVHAPESNGLAPGLCVYLYGSTDSKQYHIARM